MRILTGYLPFERYYNKMKTIYTTIFILYFSVFAFGQTNSKLGIDCNPKLNSEEIAFIKNIFSKDTLNLSNKNIGFARINGSTTWSFDKAFVPITKKEFFNYYSKNSENKLVCKLIFLDSSQQITTKGFSAIILVFNRKYERKYERTNFKQTIDMFGYRELNYPNNLEQLVIDTSSNLSLQEALLLNQIYETSRNGFDFTNKKIAFVITDSKIIVRKQEYISKIKKHLERDFVYPYDFVYILNEQEKKETKGYDAVIIFSCKKCQGKDAIEILKQNGT